MSEERLPTVDLPSVPEMSLRDFFAAAALQGILANPSDDFTKELNFSDIAPLAFSYADAMLTERSKCPTP